MISATSALARGGTDRCLKGIEYIWVYEPSSPWFPAIVELEHRFFGGATSEAPPESAEGLAALLSIGARFLVQVVSGSLNGCLELVEVKRLANVNIALFPQDSPTRRLLAGGVIKQLDKEDLLVHGWIGRTWRAMALVNPLRELSDRRRVLGFVLSADERAVRRYDRIGFKSGWLPALYGESDAHWIYALQPAGTGRLARNASPRGSVVSENPMGRVTHFEVLV